MIKINRSFSNFHHFWGVYDHKVPTKSNQWVESVRETGINSFLWKTCILGAIYHRIWQQLQMVFSHPPSGTMKLTSGSNQWYKRGQKSPLDPTALAKLLHSGYSLVHNRLKTSKMANIMIPPPPPPGLKQIFGKTNHVGVSEGSLWTFSHREIQINILFCSLPSVMPWRIFWSSIGFSVWSFPLNLNKIR